MMERYELPDSWEWVNLGECVDILDSQRIPINERERTKRISGKDKPSLYPYYGATQQVGWIDEFLFDEELLLLGEDGAPFLEPNRSKAYLITGKSWVNNHAHVLRAKKNIAINAFLQYYLNVFDYSEYVSGTTRLKLNQAKMREIPVSLPPLPEQQRIVAKIESLFEQSRTARIALTGIPVLMAQFRRAALASAFRGELVEPDPNDKSAESLLERVNEARKSIGSKKLMHSEIVVTDNLPAIPETWVWTTLEVLAEIRNGVTKGRDLSRFETVEIPYLRVANVQDGYLDLQEMKTIKVKKTELEKVRVRPNDILFIEGGDRDKLGRGTVWRGEIEVCTHQNHVHCGRLYLQDIIPNWVSLASQLSYARDYFFSAANQTVNLASLNSTQLKGLPVPLPPMNEQKRILEKINALFAQVDIIEQTASMSLRRAEQIDQSILARAVRGELG